MKKLDFSSLAKGSKDWDETESNCKFQKWQPNTCHTSVPFQQLNNLRRERAASEQIKQEDFISGTQSYEFSVPSPQKDATIPVTLHTMDILVDYGIDKPIYVYFHGGGFIVGSNKSEEAVCRRIVKELNIEVYSVNYRHTDVHADGNKWPAALEDAQFFMGNLFLWLRKRQDRRQIIVGGVESGAHLAMQVVERWKTRIDNHIGDKLGRPCSCPVIKGVVLGTPWVYLDRYTFPEHEFPHPSLSSREQCALAPLLNETMLLGFYEALKDPLRPLQTIGFEKEPDYSKWPKAWIMVAGNDPLRDDGLLLAHKLRLARVPYRVMCFKGLPHDFRRFNDLSASKKWDSSIVSAINWILSDQPCEINDGLMVTSWVGRSKY